MSNACSKESELWINEIYRELIELLKIKKPLPLELFNGGSLYGYVASKSYIIEIADYNSKTKKKRIIETKFKPYAIRIDRNLVEVSHEYQNNHLLPFAIRTLLHEIIHVESGKIKHSKKFYRAYFKLCVKYCAYKLNISKNQAMKDAELKKYINRYVLS